MSLFSGILKAIRPLVPDSVVNRRAREYFNEHYQVYGTLNELEIDSANHRIIMDLALKGESEPLHLVIDEYELSDDGGQTFLEIKRFTTSREWINLVGRDLLKEKKFPVPKLIKAIL
jgi:hypothetical protein